jgi:transposase
MYISAVDIGKFQGKTVESIAKAWGVNKNTYTRYKKQLAESGSLKTLKRSGRKEKET